MHHENIRKIILSHIIKRHLSYGETGVNKITDDYIYFSIETPQHSKLHIKMPYDKAMNKRTLLQTADEHIDECIEHYDSLYMTNRYFQTGGSGPQKIVLDDYRYAENYFRGKTLMKTVIY